MDRHKSLSNAMGLILSGFAESAALKGLEFAMLFCG
jgi:hypothetical protein